jgi:hypothetical protein
MTTTITLEVPDELASRLTPVKNQLPLLLAFALELVGAPDEGLALLDPTAPIITEVIEFLAQGPTSSEILAFKVSRQAQDRLEELLDKNREGALTPQEKAELDTYHQINHLLILLKARARAAFASTN